MLDLKFKSDLTYLTSIYPETAIKKSTKLKVSILKGQIGFFIFSIFIDGNFRVFRSVMGHSWFKIGIQLLQIRLQPAFIIRSFFISTWSIRPWHSIKAFMCLNKTAKAFMCLKSLLFPVRTLPNLFFKAFNVLIFVSKDFLC